LSDSGVVSTVGDGKVRRIGIVGKRLPAPAAADVATDVAAGPGENRYRRQHRRRLVGLPRAEVGGIGRRTGRECDAGHPGKQKLLHLHPREAAKLSEIRHRKSAESMNGSGRADDFCRLLHKGNGSAGRDRAPFGTGIFGQLNRLG
jgi:hypothetical protein